MNIAVVLTKDEKEGGAFQYALSLSLLLEKNRSDRYKFVFFTTVKKNIDILGRYKIRAVYLPWSNFDRCGSILSGSYLIGGIFTKMKMTLELKLDRIFRKHNIDLVYFLSPADLALGVSCHNYIFTVLDLCFLDFMEFPEVYINREFERKESLYRSVLSKAIAVITDSEFTKDRIAKRYGVGTDRIFPVSFLPTNAISSFEKERDRDSGGISKKYNIRDNYVFYPAQFWQHKNHVYILDGLKLLKEKYNLKIDAVFAGSDKGNLSFILRKAEELGIADQIHYIGFVDDNELPHLYARALALVMPTYFGPTNIPPLDAFAIGCPVLYPDLPGLREQVKDSAVLLDLNDPDSMCRGLLKILENSQEISAMVENGRKRIGSLLREDRWGVLKAIFDDYAAKMRLWKRQSPAGR